MLDIWLGGKRRLGWEVRSQRKRGPELLVHGGVGGVALPPNPRPRVLREEEPATGSQVQGEGQRRGLFSRFHAGGGEY